jgi:hypothetical protein
MVLGVFGLPSSCLSLILVMGGRHGECITKIGGDIVGCIPMASKRKAYD